MKKIGGDPVKVMRRRKELPGLFIVHAQALLSVDMMYFHGIKILQRSCNTVGQYTAKYFFRYIEVSPGCASVLKNKQLFPTQLW